MISRQGKSESANLAFTLLVVSFSYIILTAPSAILVLGWNYFGVTQGFSKDGVQLLRTAAKLLLNLNSSINFFQYIITGKTFREATHNLMKSMTLCIIYLKCKRMLMAKTHIYLNNVHVTPRERLDQACEIEITN